MISFFNEDVSMPNLSVDILVDWINSVITTEEFISGDINVIFCSDDYLLKMNKKYLQHDYFTDVITFDYTESSIVSGDIFISVDRIKDNAKQFDVSYDLELNRIMIHGTLHLLGYHDKSSEERANMTLLENKYLDILINKSC